MTGYRPSSFLINSPMWIDFWLLFALKFIYIFFLHVFCFSFIWRAADSSLAVLDFFLAHRAVPYVPCTSRHGLFAPRGIARSEIRFAWLWGKRRKPCVKQSQNGSVLDLFAAVNGRRKSFRRKLHRSENWTKWNNFAKIVKQSQIFGRAESSVSERARNMKQSAGVKVWKTETECKDCAEPNNLV